MHHLESANNVSQKMKDGSFFKFSRARQEFIDPGIAPQVKGKYLCSLQKKINMEKSTN